MSDIDNWNKCIEYLTNNTRFNLNIDCPNRIITEAQLKNMRNAVKKHSQLYNTLTISDVYIHDGTKIIYKHLYGTISKFIKFMGYYISNCSEDIRNELEPATIEEFKLHNPDHIGYISWKNAWSELSNTSKSKIMLMAYNSMDKSNIPFNDHAELMEITMNIPNVTN